ncbi:uncharacterized [Tachysurus ichikawai]
MSASPSEGQTRSTGPSIEAFHINTLLPSLGRQEFGRKGMWQKRRRGSGSHWTPNGGKNREEEVLSARRFDSDDKQLRERRL